MAKKKAKKKVVRMKARIMYQMVTENGSPFLPPQPRRDNCLCWLGVTPTDRIARSALAAQRLKDGER